MPKRSRPTSSESTNPLSSARKDVGSKRNAAIISKADQTAQSLWHRKSGAGYHLFLSYYGAQPSGVVVADDGGEGSRLGDGKDGGGAHQSINNNDNGNGVVRGMSRAAKRRRQKQKKKSRPTTAVENNVEQSTNTDQKDEPLGSCTQNTSLPLSHNVQQKMDSSHPLIEAFASTSNNHTHLTPFVHALSRPLPLTLRFREHEQSTTKSEELKQLLATNHSHHIAPVSYDPTNSIYQSTPQSSLCKFNLGKISPKLKELIVEGSMNATLARQELGSMLPILSLRAVGAIKAGSKVLDLCASPGSKTLQALEIVCGNKQSSNNSSGKQGRVIANDVHTKRLDSLRSAVLRSGLPTSLVTNRVTYTNYDASLFPSPKSNKLFHAIICDVPCGGDGTIRKDKHILPMWSPNISNSIHGLQVRILERALELVKVGGVVCYSTCSLNPVEDEAVVGAVLSSRRQVGIGGDGDSDGPVFELMEWPQDMLPGFIRQPGVKDWKVAIYDQDNVGKDNDAEDADDADFGKLMFFDSYEQAVAAGMEEAKRTLWPPNNNSKSNSSGNGDDDLHLDRCTRLLPQDQDTGGFFLALIKRIG